MPAKKPKPSAVSPRNAPLATAALAALERIPVPATKSQALMTTLENLATLGDAPAVA